MAEYRIERTIEISVAMLFGAACAYATLLLLPAGAWLGAGVSGMVGFAGALATLRRVDQQRAHSASFIPAPLPAFPELEPLVLDANDRSDDAKDQAAASHLENDMLQLEDALAEVGPDSRVVQLFGRPSVATAGELAVRIDTHLANRAGSRTTVADASSELFDALNELRSSLR